MKLLQKLKYGIVLVLTLAMVLGFTACSNTSKTPSTDKTPSNNVPPTSDEYDAILKSGDSYHIVIKHIDEFSGSFDMIGVVNDNGEWIHELSQYHPFIKNGIVMTAQSTVVVGLPGGQSTEGYEASIRFSDMRKSIQYVGEAMFVLHYATNGNSENSYILFNAETGQGADIGVCYNMTGFSNDYMIACSNRKVNSRIKIIDRNGNISSPDIWTDRGKIGQYAENVFWGGKNFYNIDGSVAINLSDYDIVNAPYFENGKSYVEIQNNSGTIYYTEIDHQGKFLFDPVKKN